MRRSTCGLDKHIWHVHSVGDRLNTSNLRHGHRCECGKMYIAQVECSQDCRHKRVVNKSTFDAIMEDR